MKELEALMSLYDAIESPRFQHPESDSPRAVTFRLLDVVHGYIFQHFFWLQDQRAAKKANDAEQGVPADAPKDARG